MQSKSFRHWLTALPKDEPLWCCLQTLAKSDPLGFLADFLGLFCLFKASTEGLNRGLTPYQGALDGLCGILRVFKDNAWILTTFSIPFHSANDICLLQFKYCNAFLTPQKVQGHHGFTYFQVSKVEESLKIKAKSRAPKRRAASQAVQCSKN